MQKVFPLALAGVAINKWYIAPCNAIRAKLQPSIKTRFYVFLVFHAAFMRVSVEHREKTDVFQVF